MHVRAVLLQREERGVEPGEAVGIRHPCRIVPGLRTFNIVYNVAVTIDLANPAGFRQAFSDHHRAVYSTAFRVLGDAAQAQDVVQDVFLRLWRKPGSFDASRGELATYLRLMARSRALDLWREGQVRGRAAERLKVVADTPSTDPAELDHDGERSARGAVARSPRRQREALVLGVLGRADRGADRPTRECAARDGEEPPAAGIGAVARRTARRCVRPLRLAGSA